MGPDIPGRKVGDLGSGGSSLTEQMEEVDVHGVEIDSVSVRFARAKRRLNHSIHHLDLISAKGLRWVAIHFDTFDIVVSNPEFSQK